MEKYSVLMTVYKKDNPDFFGLAIDSMINQTYKPDEIIIVKDGQITEELQKIIDDRVSYGIYINQIQLEKNLGLGLALNEGIKNCRNELIARMDADDYSMPNRCELQIEEFRKNPKLSIIGCPADEFINKIDNIVGCRNVPIDNQDIYKFARRRDPFNHPTVMYKKSEVQKAGYYSDYRKNQDTDLWIKMLSNGVECKNLEEHVFRFRFDENTYKKRKNWLNTKILIKIRYLAWKSGFNSFWDFSIVAGTQLMMFVLPVGFQKFMYKNILRR